MAGNLYKREESKLNFNKMLQWRHNERDGVFKLDRHTLNNADLVMTICSQCKFFPDNLLSANKIRHSTYWSTDI